MERPKTVPNLDKPFVRQTKGASIGQYARLPMRLLARKLNVRQYGKEKKPHELLVDYFNINTGTTLDQEMRIVYDELIKGEETKNWPAWSYSNDARKTVKGRKQMAPEQQQQQPVATTHNSQQDLADEEESDSRGNQESEVAQKTAVPLPSAPALVKAPKKKATKTETLRPLAPKTAQAAPETALALASDHEPVALDTHHLQEGKAHDGNKTTKRKRGPDPSNQLLESKKPKKAHPNAVIVPSQDAESDAIMVDQLDNASETSPETNAAPKPSLSNAKIKQAMQNIALVYLYLQNSPSLRVEIRRTLLKNESVIMKGSLIISARPKVVTVSKDLVQDIMFREGLTIDQAMRLVQGLSKFQRVAQPQPTGRDLQAEPDSVDLMVTRIEDENANVISPGSLEVGGMQPSELPVASGKDRLAAVLRNMRSSEDTGATQPTTSRLIEVVIDEDTLVQRMDDLDTGSETGVNNDDVPMVTDDKEDNDTGSSEEMWWNGRRYYGRGLTGNFGHVLTQEEDETFNTRFMDWRGRAARLDRMKARNGDTQPKAKRHESGGWARRLPGMPPDWD